MPSADLAITLSKNTMIDLFQSLLRIASPTGEEHALADFLCRWLAERGYTVLPQKVAGKRYNIFAGLSGPARVLFCTHLDTVLPQLPIRTTNNIVYGRGACDAKGAILAMLMAAEELRRQNIEDFGLLFVVGEELHSDGAKLAAKQDLGSKYVVLGEPTDNKLAIGQKGAVVFRLTASGTAAHSGYPEWGDSALHRIIHRLHDLLLVDWGSDPVLGCGTLNFGAIRGGRGANVICDRVEVEGIFRVATKTADILEKFISTQDPHIQYEILSASEPQYLARVSGLPTTVVSFGSDAAHLRPLGQVLLLGPGKIEHAHSDNEQIAMASIEQAINQYVHIARHLLAGMGSNASHEEAKPA